MVLTVGKVSKMFGISRTALLYYDSIGLLSPSERSASRYRLYSQDDIDRLKQIFILKNAGVPLNQISSLLLKDEEPAVFGKLMKRLGELNREIETLKQYQRHIITILSDTSLVKSNIKRDVRLFEKIISFAGIEPDKREQWHAGFEKQSPELHEAFLRLLGLSDEEIKTIKKNSLV